MQYRTFKRPFKFPNDYGLDKGERYLCPEVEAIWRVDTINRKLRRKIVTQRKVIMSLPQLHCGKYVKLY